MSTIVSKTKLILLIFLAFIQVSSSAVERNVIYRKVSDREKSAMYEEYKAQLDAYRKQNGGKIVIAQIKPYITEIVGDYYVAKHITMEEIEKLKKRFEAIENNTKLTDDEKYTKLLALLDLTIEEVRNTPIKCMASQKVCNKSLCCSGMVCAEEPHWAKKNYGNSCKAEKKRCSLDSECCSGECLDRGKNIPKICASVKRCYKPVKLGGSCNNNPICEAGSCRSVNFNTNFIGECKSSKQKCSSDKECCSGNCENKKCEKVYQCKQCVKQGGEVKRGLKCCEGLIKGRNGRCIPDAPPLFVKAEQRLKRIAIHLLNFVISPVYAEDIDVSILRIIEEELPDSETRSQVLAKIPLDITSRDKLADEIISLKNSSGSTEELVKGIQQALVNYGVSISGEGAVGNANLEAQKIIKENKKSFESGINNNIVQASISEGQSVHEKAVPYLSDIPGSNFETCEINFKNDFYISLQEKDMLRPEMTLLAFEFVALGEPVQDYWKFSFARKQKDGLHNNLKKMAENLRKTRRELNADMTLADNELTCLCYDSLGYENLDSEEKKKFYENSCPTLYQDYLKQKELLKDTSGTDVAKSMLHGDASSIKYLRMLSAWTDNMSKFVSRSYSRNKSGLIMSNRVNTFIKEEAKWSETDTKDYSLYNFTVQDMSSYIYGLGAVVGALLAAGAIAIAGGFATGATLSAWAATGIIATSALTGAGGFYILGALKGAWHAKTPEIKDTMVQGKESYKCGKKSTCTDFKRVLKQPYSKICNANVSSNACIRKFLVTSEKDDKVKLKSRTSSVDSISDYTNYYNKVMAESDDKNLFYLIDPWVPYDMKRADLFTSQGIHVEKLESGFTNALKYMRGEAPLERQPETYLQKVTLGPNQTAHYGSLINREQKHRLTDQMKDKIKQKAKDYAVLEGFIESSNQNGLDEFAEYAYKYHFIWPKAVPVSDGSISYPPPGLVSYINIINFGLSAITESNKNEKKAITDLQKKYKNQLLDRLNLFNEKGKIGEGELFDKFASEVKQIESELNELDKFETAFANIENKINTSGLLGATSASGTSGGALSLQNTINGLGATNTRFLNELQEVEKIKEEQAAVKEAYNKEMANNPDRKNAVASSTKKLVDNFYNPLDEKNKPSFFVSATDGKSALNNLKKDLLKNPFKKSHSKVRYGNGGNSSDLNSGRGSKSEGETGNEGFDDGSLDLLADETSDIHRSQGAISSAIKARNNQPKSKYNPNKKDSLFDILTKAYIRSYDRILKKK